MKDRRSLKLIGTRIRSERIRAEMTQECLAELAGIHWKTLGRIERGEFAFSIIVFARLAQHLSVNPAMILADVEKPDVRRALRIKKSLARKRVSKQNL